MRRFLSDMATVKHVPIPKNGVDYRQKVVLAPMVRSSVLPTRLVALQYGADLVWGMRLPQLPSLLSFPAHTLFHQSFRSD
jgi:hypothetical protein